MFCKKCGSQINDGSAFCPECGTKQFVITAGRETEEHLDQKEITAQEIQDNPYAEDHSTTSVNKELQSDTKKAKNKKKKMAIIIAFIIVLIAFIVTTGTLCVFTQGLKNNILITLASCVIPAAVGVGFNALGNAFKNSDGMQRFLHIFGSVFNCFCPILLMFVCFCAPYHLNRSIVIIVALSLSFLGYIPAHYNKNHSLMKNNVLGVINLFSMIFMWSFISYYISAGDALQYVLKSQTIGKYGEATVLMFKVGIILMLLQTLKLIAEKFDDGFNSLDTVHKRND